MPWRRRGNSSALMSLPMDTRRKGEQQEPKPLDTGDMVGVSASVVYDAAFARDW